MKRALKLVLVAFVIISCQKENLTKFPPEALQEKMLSITGENTTFEKILQKYQGKTIFVDIWASWCRDCLVGIPGVKEIQKNNPAVTYLFLSLDRNMERWQKAVEKQQLIGEHYYVPSGMKGTFGKAIGLSWIPRYMVINPDGSIKLFEAIKTTDSALLEAIQ
ncbi:thiol-disulfide isomerase/thioredoxin [Kordia periserrulae]|uniref:Thiol-disulfide isomerase/thioredoxin n=1 Tax=Kordia periserrulae TaxID=701523 RepID=A0A2T6BTM3_9FLAO|nr:TlpA disulfide reductase family protein [Kordia periserrulae]PTX59435.1 thiol-disulfide isomerase/thioredoxin [Kordia periserrulae]